MALVPAEELRSASLGEATVAVLGYGSQGRAQALNLRDSGVSVIVGLRAGSPHRARAEADGLRVQSPAEAAAGADLVAMLVPDEVQPDVYATAVEPNLRHNGALVFAHGYNIHFRLIEPRPDLDVILVAPSGIGEQVRARYAAGHGTAGFVAVDHDASGGARTGPWPMLGRWGRGAWPSSKRRSPRRWKPICSRNKRSWWAVSRN